MRTGLKRAAPWRMIDGLALQLAISGKGGAVCVHIALTVPGMSMRIARGFCSFWL